MPCGNKFLSATVQDIKVVPHAFSGKQSISTFEVGVLHAFAKYELGF